MVTQFKGTDYHNWESQQQNLEVADHVVSTVQEQAMRNIFV